MPRTLVLMRHARAARALGVADHARPLEQRGIVEAGLAGRWLRDAGVDVDGVVCSTSLRTRQTWAAMGVEAPVDFRDALYDATGEEVLDVVTAVVAGAAGGALPDDPTTLLVVGHQPAVGDLTWSLAGRGSDESALRCAARGHPTSALAVLEVPDRWTDLRAGSAALRVLHVPR